MINPERTIEELLGWDTEKLLALPPEELSLWIGDAVTRQDEILAKVPAYKTGATKARLSKESGGTMFKNKKGPDLSQLPPEMLDIMKRAQAALSAAAEGGLKK